MTRTEILRAASPWPMYAHELGDNQRQLAALEQAGFLESFKGFDRMYQTTWAGKVWLLKPWWRRLWS